MEALKLISNPYLEVGNLHNEGLDYVINHLVIGKPVTIEQIIGLTSDYAKLITETTAKIDYAMDYAFIAKVINELELKSLSEILRYARLSEKSVCFINSMLHFSDDIDYHTILKFLENNEENILHASINENEKQFPLLFVAVAKSSVTYWMAQVKNTSTKWKPFVEAAGMNMTTAKWSWKEDGQGALAGMFMGALAGITGNGIHGAGASGFSSAVCCSVAVSVAIAFNKLFK